MRPMIRSLLMISMATLTLAAPGRTDWGPVVGVGARIGLTPALATRAELQDYLYAHGPGATISHFRGDFILSLGLSATLFGRSVLAR